MTAAAWGAPLLVAAALGLQMATARAQEPAARPLPEGEGRETVQAWCGACHSTAMVRQQSMDRRRWEDTLRLMVEKYGMAEPDEETRSEILGYLASKLGPQQAQGCRQTPWGRRC